jgi:hypothetical protein
MDISFTNLNYSFIDKPLLVGGKALEYYGIRKAGHDIDFVVSSIDHNNLKNKFPDNIKDLYGDIGICEYSFEIWNQICCFKYTDLKTNAIEKDTFLVASLEKLVLLKTIAMHVEKYRKDLELLGKYILDIQYGKKKLPV